MPAAVIRWALEKDRGVLHLRGLTSPVRLIWISADSRKLAALGDDFLLGVWSVPEGRLLRLIEAPRGASPDNADVAFSADGRQLAFATWHDARLYDLATGAVVRQWSLPDGYSDELETDPQGRMLLVRRECGLGRPHPSVWRLRELVADGTSRVLFEQTDTNWFTYICRLPAGGRMFLVNQRGEKERCRIVQGYDTASGRKLWELPTSGHDGEPPLLLDAAGQWLIYPEDLADKHIGVFRLLDGVKVGELPMETGAISPSLGILAHGVQGGVAWSEQGAKQNSITVRSGPLPTSNLEFSPDGRLLAWGAQDGSVFVANLARVGQRIRLLERR